MTAKPCSCRPICLAAGTRRTALVMMLLAFGCTARSDEEPDMRVTIEDVLARRTPELMRIDGVEGVGQALCDSTPCIRVYVRTDEVTARLPKQLEGYTVDAVVTGTVRPRTGD